MLQSLKERSKRTRLLLSQQFGVDSDEGLSQLLGNTSRKKSKKLHANCKNNQIDDATLSYHINYRRPPGTVQD